MKDGSESSNLAFYVFALSLSRRRQTNLGRKSPLKIPASVCKISRQGKESCAEQDFRVSRSSHRISSHLIHLIGRNFSPHELNRGIHFTLGISHRRIPKLSQYPPELLSDSLYTTLLPTFLPISPIGSHISAIQLPC